MGVTQVKPPVGANDLTGKRIAGTIAETKEILASQPGKSVKIYDIFWGGTFDKGTLGLIVGSLVLGRSISGNFQVQYELWNFPIIADISTNGLDIVSSSITGTGQWNISIVYEVIDN